MPIRRFFLSTLPNGTSAVLGGTEAHHLIHVLRVKTGSSIEMIDGAGGLWSGKVGQILPDKVYIVDVVLLSQDTQVEVPIILIQAICKSDRLTWILQKITELGIAEIYLINAQRSVVKLTEQRVEAKLIRWRTILTNAAKQSRHTTLPKLHPPLDCQQFCQTFCSDLKLILNNSLPTSNLRPVLLGGVWRSVAFSIGPEGGWTDEECATFLHHGFQSVSLGTNTLRTETAAIVTAALLKHELSQW